MSRARRGRHRNARGAGLQLVGTGRMVGWIFFDVGNVILDEDPLTYRVFMRHVEAIQRIRPDLAFDDLLARREALARSGSRWPVYEMAASDLADDELARVWDECERHVRAHYAELSPLIPGVRELLEVLSQNYRLGVIANQPVECRGHLARLGLLDRFDVAALSAERGAAKPDPALFRWALDQAGATAGDCLMVGDRPDNDLAPAAALGMATAWIRWPDRAAKGWGGDDPQMGAYLRSLERCAAEPPPGVVPRYSVAETRELQSLALVTGREL